MAHSGLRVRVVHLRRGTLLLRRLGLGEWSVHVQFVPGHHVKLVPKFLFCTFFLAFLGHDAAHDTDNGGGTFAALGLVGDGQTMLHHLVDAASVFWDDQVIAHAVVAQRVKVDGSVRHRSRLLKLQSMLFCLRLESRDGTIRFQPPGCGTKDTRFIAFPHNSMSCSKASPNDVSCPSWAWKASSPRATGPAVSLLWDIACNTSATTTGSRYPTSQPWWTMAAKNCWLRTGIASRRRPKTDSRP